MLGWSVVHAYWYWPQQQPMVGKLLNAMWTSGRRAVNLCSETCQFTPAAAVKTRVQPMMRGDRYPGKSLVPQASPAFPTPYVLHPDEREWSRPSARRSSDACVMPRPLAGGSGGDRHGATRARALLLSRKIARDLNMFWRNEIICIIRLCYMCHYLYICMI